MADADHPAATFDWTTFESPSNAVVDAISTETNADPLELEPLYGRLDPDALDALVASMSRFQGAPDASIEFEYQNYRVQINATGRGYLYDDQPPAQSTDAAQPSYASTNSE